MDSSLEFKKPNLFGVDLDGTFYTKNQESLSKNIEAFKNVTALGHKVFFCTGRPPYFAASWVPNQFQEKTKYNGNPGVYFNGGLVIDVDGSVLVKVVYPKEFLAKIVQYIQEYKYEKHIVFFDEYWHYTLVQDANVILGQLEIIDVLDKPKTITAEQLLQLDIIHLWYYGIEPLDNIYEYKQGIDYTGKIGVHLNDVTLLGVTKAKGLKALCQHWNVDAQDVGFIGDGNNDIEIMQLSNVSFAVANASDKVKQAAKYVLNETCDDAAFAKAMSLVYRV